MIEKQFLQRLKSIKHYFFLELGDFFVHFLDSAEDELNKPTDMVSKERLESLLEMSLRTSSANNDLLKDDLTSHLSPYTLYEQVFCLYLMILFKNNFIVKLFAIQNISGSEIKLNERDNIYTPSNRTKGIEMFTLDYKVAYMIY